MILDKRSGSRLLFGFLLSTGLLAAQTQTATAQDVALKTNALYWATTTPNLGLEFRLGQKTTGQVFYGLNPWKQSGGDRSSIRHWLVMPELRHWFCQTWDGAFVGIHALGGEYNAGGVKFPFGVLHTLEDYRYKGWYIGGGITAGYQWPLSKHWSFEANIGVGYIYSPYDKHCVDCEGVLKHGHRNYVGPTKAALSLVYVFTGKQSARNTATYDPQVVTAVLSNPDFADEAREGVAAVGARMINVTDARAEQSGDRMNVSLKMNLDSLRLRSSQQLVYTPIIHTPDSDLRLPEIVINGRDQHVLYRRGVFRNRFSRQAQAVERKNKTAQTVEYLASVPVSGTLDDYELTLEEDVCGCGNVDEMNNYTVYTYVPQPKTFEPRFAFVRPQVEAVKVRHLDKRAYIDFPVDRTELHPDYRRNPEQLDTIINTINALKADPDLAVRNINIHGYASPESPYEHNDMLARGRAKTLTDFVRQQVDLPESVFTVSSTAEDWDGLREYLRGSSLEHRDQILAIANDSITLAPDAREWKIKTTYPEEYRYMLQNWYPALRHSDYHITYTVRPFNVDEAKQKMRTQPQLLSQEEMFLVAQTYETGSRDFNDAMETAVRMFPDNPTANLNAAITRIEDGRLAEAKPYLDKAGDSSDADNARGVYYYLTGDSQQAATYFRRAADAGNEYARLNADDLEKIMSANQKR